MEGKIEVEIEAYYVDFEVIFLEDTLIMYVTGKDLNMYSVKQYMIRYWNFVQLLEMFYHEERYFLLKIRTSEDKEMVLTRGLYSIKNMPMVLKDRSHDFNFKRDMILILPVWVKLPQLPLHLWGAKSLGKIGSALGKPLFTDECTMNKLRVSYVCIFVEIDIAHKQKDSIIIKDNEGMNITQPVELERTPKFCDTCQKIGHQCNKEKPRIVKQLWEVTTTVSSQHIEEEIPTTLANHGTSSWTQVTKNKKNKGKMVM